MYQKCELRSVLLSSNMQRAMWRRVQKLAVLRMRPTVGAVAHAQRPSLLYTRSSPHFLHNLDIRSLLSCETDSQNANVTSGVPLPDAQIILTAMKRNPTIQKASHCSPVSHHGFAIVLFSYSHPSCAGMLRHVCFFCVYCVRLSFAGVLFQSQGIHVPSKMPASVRQSANMTFAMLLYSYPE